MQPNAERLSFLEKLPAAVAAFLVVSIGCLIAVLLGKIVLLIVVKLLK